MNVRVLMIAPTPFFGDRGCHIRILEEVRALEAAGVRVLLLTYPAGKDVSSVETRRLKWGGRFSGEKVGPDAGKFLLDGVMFLTALRECKSFGPDIIHGHLHEGCLIGYAVGRLMGRPVVFDYQGSLAGEMSQHGFLSQGSLAYAAFGRMERFIDGLPDAVLVSTRSMIRARLGRRSPEWFVVPDAVDPGMFRPMGRDAKLADKLGLPQDKPICAFLGLLNRYQGADLLLNAVSAMKLKYGARVHFLIMGYPDVERYESRAAELGVGDCVTFPGRVPYELAPRYLCLGDIAVAPKIATTESNGKIIDYMACGLPTVALDTAVNRDLLGEAGFFVPWRGREAEAALALADAVVSLAENEKLRDKLKIMGRERVVEHFSRDVLKNRLLRIYNTILGG